MRAIQRTKFFRLGLLYGVAGAISAVAACADSLHLDPPGALPRADGGAGVACTSNLECAYPKALCDTVAQTCVECIVASDCSALPGTVCSYESCVCKPPQVHCAGGESDGGPYCVDSCGTGGTGGGGGAGTGGAGTGGAHTSSSSSSSGGEDGGRKVDGGDDAG